MNYTDHYLSPLGDILLTADDEGLTGLHFTDDGKGVEDEASDTREKSNLPVFQETARWLDLYFSGKNPGFTPPLHLTATPFQRRVWDILLEIPYGQNVTYGEIARRMEAEAGSGRVSARAVGGAAGKNPVLLIVPCHRVVGRGGRLTGYADGVWRKERLLALEKRNLSVREGTAFKA